MQTEPLQNATAAENPSKTKLSLRERLAAKAQKTGSRAIVFEEYRPPVAAQAAPPGSSRDEMLKSLNAMRWEQQRAQIEPMIKQRERRLNQLYEELINVDWGASSSNHRLYVASFVYRALNGDTTREEMLQQIYDFAESDWREIVEAYITSKKVTTFQIHGNIDEWEEIESEERRALFGIGAPPSTSREVRPPKAPRDRPLPPPKPLAEPRAPRPIAFKGEEVLERGTLLARAADAGLGTFNEAKEPLVIIFIGHVDSGKSTIAGSILLSAGKIVDAELARLKEEARQHNRESWYMAYLLDCNEEERERGKTVEMGRAEFELEHKRFTLFDCPGHRNYVQNMMAGAAQADVAALIISARDGEFEAGFEREGQTREHAMLARAVGVTRLVVVVNKMDSVQWSETRFTDIQTRLGEFLSQSCGFAPSDVFWCAISALHGVYVERAPEPSPAPWFKGRSLLETLDALPRVERSQLRVLRVPLLDRAREDGELFVFGKVESGIVRTGMQCVLMPYMRTLTVAAVASAEGERVYFAGPGESVKLSVRGLEEEEIRRGTVVCGTQFWPHVCVEFEAEVSVLQLLAHQTLTAGFDFTLHLHTLMEEAVVSRVISRTERLGASVSAVPAHILRAGEKGLLRIRVRTPICVEKVSEVPQLGRLVMRKESNTIALGSIVRVRLINKETLKNNCFFAAESVGESVAAPIAAIALENPNINVGEFEAFL